MIFNRKSIVPQQEKEVGMMSIIIEDFLGKYPKGASFKEVNEFCDIYSSWAPQGSKLREDIITRIGHYGE